MTGPPAAKLDMADLRHCHLCNLELGLSAQGGDDAEYFVDLDTALGSIQDNLDGKPAQHQDESVTVQDRRLMLLDWCAATMVQHRWLATRHRTAPEERETGVD